MGILWHTPLGLAGGSEISMDGWVLAFATAITVTSGVLFGILPACRVGRTDPQAVLQSAARGTTDARHGLQARRVLTITEVALSAMCLVAAGLLLSSFARLLHVDKGFQAEHALTTLGLPEVRYPSVARRAQFVRDLVECVGAVHGVLAAGVSNRGPLTGEGSNLSMFIDGVAMVKTQRPVADYRCVSPQFFRAMGIPLIDGQMFSETMARGQLRWFQLRRHGSFGPARMSSGDISS
jgi:hypothetical protein